MERLYEGLATQDYYHHAKHCHLLVRPPLSFPMVPPKRTPKGPMKSPFQQAHQNYRSSYEMAKAYFKRTLRDEQNTGTTKL